MLLTEKKKWKRSAIKSQQMLKTVVRNATTAMFQNKKLKRNPTSAVAEVAEVALCASNCALLTSTIPYTEIPLHGWHFRLLPAHHSESSAQPNTQYLASNSAIGLHLLQNPNYDQHYDDKRFSILAQGRSPFHLSALRPSFIKVSSSALCRQKNSCTA